MNLNLFLACFLFVAVVGVGQNAAPSSHIVFDDNFEGDILVNEVRVPENGVAMYTYYEALGWRGDASGYAGIQVHPRANNFIFSIWDHKAHKAPIRAVYTGPGTLTEEFGGEGTGLKSWNFELGWEPNTWYTLVSRSWAVRDHTYYGFWARSGKTKRWTHLVTMDVAAKNAYFQGGTDAFIEDWLETGKNLRTTNLRGGWKRKTDGEWYPFQSGRYSVNYWDLESGKRSFNFKTNWDGGVAKDETGLFYFMTAGGKSTKPSVNNPSRHEVTRTEAKPPYERLRLLKAEALMVDLKLSVKWEVDERSLPPFQFRLKVLEQKMEDIVRVIAAHSEVKPHGRFAEMILPEIENGGSLWVEIKCSDILGNESKKMSIKIDRTTAAAVGKVRKPKK